MQMVGCVTMGLGYVLRVAEVPRRRHPRPELHVRAPRFSQVPHIETILIKNVELSLQGGGGRPSRWAPSSPTRFDATGLDVSPADDAGTRAGCDEGVRGLVVSD